MSVCAGRVVDCLILSNEYRLKCRYRKVKSYTVYCTIRYIMLLIAAGCNSIPATVTVKGTAKV